LLKVGKHEKIKFEIMAKRKIRAISYFQALKMHAYSQMLRVKESDLRILLLKCRRSISTTQSLPRAGEMGELEKKPLPTAGSMQRKPSRVDACN
jgi:hypothetical protein